VEEDGTEVVLGQPVLNRRRLSSLSRERVELNVWERRRIAVGLMLLGLVCVGFSVVSVIMQRAEQRRLQGKSPEDVQVLQKLKLDQPKLAKYWLVATGTIIVVFLLGSLAITRFRKRLLKRLATKPAGPTPTDDAWQMHKPPDVPPDELYEQPNDGRPDA
jgi:ABC-type Fe3+ transport system permease subunit